MPGRTETQPHVIQLRAGKIAKAILDAIKGYAFHDDAQVCRLVVARNASDVERVRITVRKVRDLAAWPKG